jgi:predicted nucleic acid-binding protein
MTTLEFNPTVYRIQFESMHGLSTWDLLTVEGVTPNETVYFLKKGDAPSASESEKINEAIENEEWEIIQLDAEDFEKERWSINTNIFETAGEAYSSILEILS